MHRFKRITAAVVVSAAMMMSIVPAVVFADDIDEEDTDNSCNAHCTGYSWTIDI